MKTALMVLGVVWVLSVTALMGYFVGLKSSAGNAYEDGFQACQSQF